MGSSFTRTTLALIILILCTLLAPPSASGQYSVDPTDWFNNQNVHSSLGTVNALGIGTPLAGVTVAQLDDGALYFRQYTITITGLGAGQTANLTAYVYDNFNHPSALIFRHCPVGGGCNAQAGYNATTPTRRQDAVPLATNVRNGTYTIGLAVYVPDNNGASAYNGTDSGAVRIMANLSGYPWPLNSSLTIYMDTPNEVVQQALRLTLTGARVSPAGGTYDYTINFGTVDGLGIANQFSLPGGAKTGGYLYYTPYQLKTDFGAFTSTTASLSTYVTPNFTHSQALRLDHSTVANINSFAAISVSSGTPTLITNSAVSRGSTPAYLGLFVSDRNDAYAFTGTDSATLTFTMTVP